MKLLRRFWKFLIWLRYQSVQRWRLSRPRVTRLKGRNLLVLPGVFDPVVFRSSAVLADLLQANALPASTTVLDLGTGTGVLALMAAAQGCRVVAVDINPDAVRCARINALLHGLQDWIEVWQADLFTGLPEGRFDLILFNPPYLTGQPRSLAERALRDPDMPERFAGQLRTRLEPSGSALMVLSTEGQSEDYLRALEDERWYYSMVAERDLISEILRVYRVGDVPVTGGRNIAGS